MPLPQRLEICAGLRDRVALDLIGPLGIDRLNIWRDGQSQIEGQIGHIERPPIETERRACREQQPLRDAVLVDAVEIAELARTLPVWSIVLPLNMANLRRGSPVRVELGSRTLGARRSAPGAERNANLRSAASGFAPKRTLCAAACLFPDEGCVELVSYLHLRFRLTHCDREKDQKGKRRTRGQDDRKGSGRLKRQHAGE